MNAKYALALILALQVSVSLCEVPTPSQDLVEKYDAMKTVFLKRIMNAFGKLQGVAAPVIDKVGDSERGQIAKDYIEELQEKPEYQTIVKVFSGMGQELGPLVEKARTTVLGLYEHYLRAQVGDFLSEAIDNIKVYLDKHLPAE